MWLRAGARALQSAADAWSKLQVELHGKYSIERMRTFHAYSASTSWARILLWCILTPVPCLAVNVLLDIAPLANPSAGRDANYVYWIRATVSSSILLYTIFMQIGFLAPGLGMTHRHIFWMALLVTAGCVSFDYILTGFIPMPVPFGVITATPVFMIIFGGMFAFFFGRKLRNSVPLRSLTMKAMNVVTVQITLSSVYPIFIYGFNSIPPVYEIPYLILLPVIKITAKNIMSKFVDSIDMKPEILVFCIDTFHSISISVAMQKATTISSMQVIMLIDIAQACVSVYDIYQEFQPLRWFMDRIPVGHSLSGKCFLEVAIALDQRGMLSSLRDLRGRRERHATLSQGIELKALKTVRVLPADKLLACAKDAKASTGELHDLVSEEDRKRLLSSTRKLLFTTEFVILIEYTEVIMPVFYSWFTIAVYYLPNRDFYAIVAGIHEHEFLTRIATNLLYAALELLSLLILNLVLLRITGVSAMRQVGFVLDTQRVMVQSKLLSWVFYGVQNSLEHAGADFSFQFKWLRSGRKSST